MFGWWLDRERGNGTIPVTSSSPLVEVTSYVRKGHATMLAIASFAKVNISVTLSINWAKLGLSPSTKLAAPVLLPFQPRAATFAPTDSLNVPAGQGWILLLE